MAKISGGIWNPSYTTSRNDIVNLIPGNVKKVLDVGCSIGILGQNIKQKYKDVEVIGIEINQQMAEAAKDKLNDVIIGDIEEINLEAYYQREYFDCVIFADVLEHLKDPWNTLKTCCKYLNRDGVVVASLPNIRHYITIVNLLIKGYWPYQERGIFDKTHLRFFTLKNIYQLFKYANLDIITLKRNYRIFEGPHQLNNFARYIAFPPLREFITFQYLIVAVKGGKNH
jgi:2-polyprenyl-3-methyl-5-hydroxy-6-metoxy-1,4-benzoquinol methylase